MRTIDRVDVEAVSHGLKTPLSVLLAQLELMRYFPGDGEKQGELIEIAAQNTYRLTRLMGNLLDLLRIDAGYGQADWADADAFSFIKDVCASADAYARAKSIELVCEAPQYGKAMPIDVDKTGRILFNLLSNAIKFTAEKGRIIVQIEDRLEDGIAFSVEDTGRGIPEDRLHSILDRSKRAGPSLAGKADGPGMGLALVKSFVEILGGSVAAVSKVGEGSRFTVELPIVKRPAGPKINVYGLNLDAKARIELSDLN